MGPEAAAHVLALLAACPRLGSPEADSAQQLRSPERQLHLALSFYHISLLVRRINVQCAPFIMQAFQLAGSVHSMGLGIFFVCATFCIWVLSDSLCCRAPSPVCSTAWHASLWQP